MRIEVWKADHLGNIGQGLRHSSWCDLRTSAKEHWQPSNIIRPPIPRQAVHNSQVLDENDATDTCKLIGRNIQSCSGREPVAAAMQYKLTRGRSQHYDTAASTSATNLLVAELALLEAIAAETGHVVEQRIKFIVMMSSRRRCW